MSFATARRDIEKRLNANWATTPIAFENVKFNPPTNAPWVKLRIFEDNVNRLNIGTPGHHRVSGTIAIEIYTLLNTGTQTARSYGDTIAAIFRDAQFNGITCREVSMSVPGEFEGWWQTNLTVPFYWTGAYG